MQMTPHTTRQCLLLLDILSLSGWMIQIIRNCPAGFVGSGQSRKVSVATVILVRRSNRAFRSDTDPTVTLACPLCHSLALWWIWKLWRKFLEARALSVRAEILRSTFQGYGQLI